MFNVSPMMAGGHVESGVLGAGALNRYLADNEQRYAQFRDQVHAKLGDVEDSKESAVDEALVRGQNLDDFGNNFAEGLDLPSSDEGNKQ